MKNYQGSSGEARTAARRGKLLKAAAGVFAARGFHGASVRSICEAAGLTERYFYESFENTEALFLALHQDTSERIVREMREAVKNVPAQSGHQTQLETFFDFFSREPAAARLFAVEAAYISQSACDVCRAWRRTIRGLLWEQCAEQNNAVEALVSEAIIKGLLSIAVEWMDNDFLQRREDIIAAGMSLLRLQNPATLSVS
ncbi:TetR/AcrR family transcriptional regulator [Pantoea piersonii]|uniref:TetR/AcrR family transcriptional regulator n=1 Tax=Pantoea piersonii TaxID=2364647 RepID=UPI00289EB584|nr:TetR/AcrR family transcriptional regulator [Pantoea piersonii]